MAAVEKKRRDFERKCMNELTTLKQILTIHGNQALLSTVIHIK